MFSRKSYNRVHDLIMDQIRDVEECVINFENFLRVAVTPEANREVLRPLFKSVADAEATADGSLRRMIDSLAGKFLPSTIEEIINVSTSCDHIANNCEGAAYIILTQNFRFPEGYADDVMEIVKITRTQFDVLEESISKLFANMGEMIKDHSILDEIRRYESQIDTLAGKLYERTFDLDLDLASKMQIRNVVERIARVSDIIEDIADSIQIMLITRKG